MSRNTKKTLNMALFLWILCFSSIMGCDNGRDVKSLLRELKSEDPGVQSNATRELGKIKDPHAVKPLIAALREYPPALNKTIKKALAQIGKASVAPLVIALKDPDWDLRCNAAEILGKIKDPRAVEPLIAALKDKSSPVRVQAASALGEIKDPRAAEPLIAVLKDKNCSVRESAVWALGEMKVPRSVEPLIASLKDDDENVRIRVIKALGKIKAPQSVEPLIALLKDKREDFRRNAAWVLGEIGDRRAIEPLIAALGDPESDVRRNAAGSLAKIGAPAVVSLIDVLKSGNHLARANAARALGEIKDPRAIGPLIDSLADAGWDDEKMVIEALAKISQPAVGPLIAALKDKGRLPRIRRNAAKALGRIKARSAVEPLVEALEDTEISVRMSAASALAEIKRSRAIEVLLSKSRSRDLAVVAGAYRFFIARGEGGTESVLIEALDKYGDAGMAKDFLNCGNARLNDRAGKWLSRHGYVVIPTSQRESPLRWGGR
jgi:HEAT repeat protein